MDAQQQHDAAMRNFKLSKGSKKRVEDLLAKKSETSSRLPQSTAFDPLASAMKRHGLTEEQARLTAEKFGF